MIALLILGPQRLPGMARSIGRGVRDLRNAVRNAGQELGVEDLEKDLRDLNELRKPGGKLDVAKELGLDSLGLDEVDEEIKGELAATEAAAGQAGETARTAEPAAGGASTSEAAEVEAPEQAGTAGEKG